MMAAKIEKRTNLIDFMACTPKPHLGVPQIKQPLPLEDRPNDSACEARTGIQESHRKRTPIDVGLMPLNLAA
jgi:hypothetical protein